MTSAQEYALNAAKEITVARMSNTNLSIGKDGGDHVAEFFEAIYKTVLELAKEAAD